MRPTRARWTGVTGLAAKIALVLGLATPAIAQSDRDAILLDVDFPGGNAIEFVEAVRKAAGDVNIVLTPGLENVRVQPVQLRRVAVPAALELLEGNYEIETGELVQVGVRHVASGHEAGGGRLLLKVESSVQRGPRQTGLESAVWSLEKITSEGAGPDDILTAIDAALGLYGPAFPEPAIRFHRETNLLIVRGHGSQLGTIDDLLNAVRRRPAGVAVDTAAAVAKAKQDTDAAWQKAANYRDQLEAVREDLTEWRTRAQLLQREIESLQEQRDDMQKLMTVQTIEHESEKVHLRAEIARLKSGGE